MPRPLLITEFEVPGACVIASLTKFYTRDKNKSPGGGGGAAAAATTASYCQSHGKNNANLELINILPFCAHPHMVSLLGPCAAQAACTLPALGPSILRSRQ